MSFFLLNQNEIDEILLNKYQSGQKHDFGQDSSAQRQIQSESLKRQSKKAVPFLTRPLRETENIKEYLLVIRTLLGVYRIAVHAQIDKKKSDLRMSLRIINPQQSFWKVLNTRSVTQLGMKVNHHLNNFKMWLIKVSFDIKSGLVHIHLPLYICYSSLLRCTKGQSIFQLIYKNHVQAYLPLLEFIVKEGTNQTFLSRSDNYNKVKSMENVLRYTQMINISNHLNESRLETEQESIAKEKVKRESIRRTINNCIRVEDCIVQFSNDLMEHRTVLNNFVPKVEKDFILQEEEMKYIRTMIAMPSQPRHRNPYENLMVLNHIYVHDLPNIRLNKFSKGGFSTIYLSEIKYFYVYSSEEHELLHPVEGEAETIKKMLHKFVIIKKEDESSGFRRNIHEINILKRIKNGSSIFLPKYYIIINKANPHSNCVVMDLISSKNLKEFMSASSQSITLLTKLFLIFAIIQALRYIRDYSIVHLDLKPNNIMIYCNMLIKLIDFGESYHHEVCSKKHKPGYTVPYSPPEIFKNESQIFLAKSDVFSLGVIMFEMIYGSYPYDIFETTERVDEIMRGYLKKWYFTPEEYETYGDVNVLRILNGLISRCLASDPVHRPELDWIALVVRQCFDLLQ